MSLLGPILGIVGLGGIGAAIAFIPGAAAAVAGIASSAINFLGKVNWAKVWWMLPIGAAVAFGLVERHGRHTAEAKIPVLQAAFAAEHKAFLTEKASFDLADAKIRDNNARIAAAGKELDREKQEAAANEARLNERWKSTQATVSALEADARDPKRKPCTVSDQAKRGLDGL